MSLKSGVMALLGALWALFLVFGAGHAGATEVRQDAETAIDCWGHGEHPVVYHAVTAAQFWGLPRGLLAGMAAVESGWNPHAVTEFELEGQTYEARGLLQIANAEVWHPHMAGREFDPCRSLNYAGWWVSRRLGGGDDPRYLTLPQVLDAWSGGAVNYYDKVMAAAEWYAARG